MAAATCADANTAATAAIIRGRQALPWLTGLRLPARLVARDGTVHTLAWLDDPQCRPGKIKRSREMNGGVLRDDGARVARPCQ